MTVAENTAPGAEVGSVVARDADTEPFSAVRYQFAVDNQARSIGQRVG